MSYLALTTFLRWEIAPFFDFFLEALHLKDKLLLIIRITMSLCASAKDFTVVCNVCAIWKDKS